MALNFLNDGYFAGKVGIGTESPSEKLEVNGTVAIGNATDGIKLRLTGTVGEILGLSTTSGSWNDLDIRTQAATQLYLKTDGNVGIGTTSPGVKLDAMESAVNNSVMTLGTASGIFSIRPSTRDYGLFFGVIYNNGDAWMQVGRSDGTAAAYNLLLQPSGGNVGIGTTAPTSRLHVNGTGATHGEYFRISNGTTQIYELQPSIYNVTNNGFGIYDVTDSAYRLVIDTSGNVGIGTTGPQSKLQVAGGIQMADDTATAVVGKVGTMRYRTGTEYVEVTGTNIVTNGDFLSSPANSGWTQGAGWTITTGNATWNAAATYTWISSSVGTVVGNVYKVSFDCVVTSGNLYVVLGNGGETPSITATGSYEYILTPTGGGSYDTLIRVYQTVANSNFSITNISAIQVTSEDASYADMCMQTGASTYEWVNIVRNTY
jgi:hypothetical protein